jgi:glycosyltransferase involved in cell wall biosynthesis
MIRTVELTSTLNPVVGGGVSSSLPDLAAALRRFDQIDSHVKVFDASWCSALWRRVDLDRAVRYTDLLHIHGLWEPHCALGARMAMHAGRPYMVSAHGYLERWALSHKWWKKRVYTWLVERRSLSGAVCLRALTRVEVDDYRRLGLKVPVACVPNGVSIPPDISSDEFLEAFSNLRNKRLVLFMGRLHYKKGIDILCRAWAARPRPDHHLVIAGPNIDNTFSETQALVEQLGITNQVTFTGMLQGKLKWSALASAELFVLPSRGEGLSMAVLEAAGAGVPLLLSNCCYFPEADQAGCGWVVDPAPVAVADALDAACEMSSTEREAMRTRCRQLILQHYTWEVISRQLSQVYRWLLTGATAHGIEIFN